MRRSIGADSLGYVSLDNLITATEQPRNRMCAACFDGHYPIPLPEDARLGKYLLEGGEERGVAGPAEPELPNSYGAEDALRRP